jgi:hypothetical protein
MMGDNDTVPRGSRTLFLLAAAARAGPTRRREGNLGNRARLIRAHTRR